MDHPVEIAQIQELTPELREKITGIRTSAKESLRNIYPHVNIHSPKDAIERAVAETILQQEEWENNIPFMRAEELNELWPKVSGWYWSDSWFLKINQALQALKKERLD